MKTRKTINKHTEKKEQISIDRLLRNIVYRIAYILSAEKNADLIFSMRQQWERKKTDMTKKNLLSASETHQESLKEKNMLMW